MSMEAIAIGVTWAVAVIGLLLIVAGVVFK